MKSHATAYIMPPGGYEDELGIISVPENFNEDELYATIQTAVNMINDALHLQKELKKKTTGNYEPSR